MDYKSEITDMVAEWLAHLPLTMTAESETSTRNAITLVTHEFGYGEPFDREQRTINKMLLRNRANYMCCRVAWGYYYDFKLLEAQNPIPYFMPDPSAGSSNQHPKRQLQF